MADINISQEQKEALTKWGATAIAFAALTSYAMYVNPKYNFGFFSAVLCFIVVSISGTIGALIGSAVCNFVKPSAVWTTGGFFSLLWIKIFWRIGPQVIGLIALGGIGGGLLLPYLSNPVSRQTPINIEVPAKFNSSISINTPTNTTANDSPSNSQSTIVVTSELSAAAEKAISEGFVKIEDPKVNSCTNARIAAIRKEIGEDAIINFSIYNEAAVQCGFNL